MKQCLFFCFVLFIFHDAFCQIGYTQKGRASYYSYPFHGRRTANGEIFNMKAYTAAHPSLAFNSLIKVTNLENKKWVIVRINDRGPYYKKRILDLSHIAARSLNFLHEGTIRIKLEVIGFQGKGKKATIKQKKALAFEDFELGKFYNRKGIEQQLKGYGVQVGAFEHKKNAIATCLHFESKGYKSVIKVFENKKGRYYRIIVGTFATEKSADKTYEKLDKKGWAGFVTPYN